MRPVWAKERSPPQWTEVGDWLADQTREVVEKLRAPGDQGAEEARTGAGRARQRAEKARTRQGRIQRVDLVAARDCGGQLPGAGDPY
jgi:hypothetical protein